MSASRDRFRKEDVCIHSSAFSPIYATQRSTKERLPLLPVDTWHSMKDFEIIEIIFNNSLIISSKFIEKSGNLCICKANSLIHEDTQGEVYVYLFTTTSELYVKE